MKELHGQLQELKNRTTPSELGPLVVEYELAAGQNTLPLSSLLGEHIELRFTGDKTCIHCGRRVKKLYQSGYCYPCVTTLAECDLCIVKPHDCHYHLGTCRDSAFGDTHCMIPHYVYLADSSSVKVGLTRKGRQLKRWMDQGATSAILLAETPTRKAAGELEMHIAEHLPDKTDWRKMLKDTGDSDADLVQVRRQVIEQLDDNYQNYVLEEPGPVAKFGYPRLAGFEPKLKSLSFDKEPVVKGVLCGIKGQYLLFEEGVLNIRKHAGFHIEVSVSSANN